MQRRPLIYGDGHIRELGAGDVPWPLTATMMAFLSHCSVSPEGQPLWDGQPWGGVSMDYITGDYVADDYVEPFVVLSTGYVADEYVESDYFG